MFICIKKQSGFTLIEIIVATLILSLTALGVFGIFQIALKTLAGDKAREGAIALLNEKIEVVRNLPYNQVGTQGGVISGLLLQQETVIKNQVRYTVNTQVLYIDDPFDGTEGGNPDDFISTDYKKVKITVLWPAAFDQKSLTMTTYVAPKGMETTVGGGTLRITALNASGLPVPQAEVRLINNQVSPPIDTLLQTNSSGILNVPGLPAAQESYKITVNKTGYNSDYTCAVDPNGANCNVAEGNPVPTKPHASVLESQLTEVSFNIDLLANLNVRTLSQAIPSIWTVNTNDVGYNQDNPSFTQCANGYYIFSWRDYRQQNNPRIYAQKYSGSQIKQWSEDLAVTTANNQNNPDLVVDANCNGYFAWQDDRNGNLDIYLDKYNSGGTRVWSSEKKVETAANSADQTLPQLAINASSTALYLIWQDNRSDTGDLYAQKFDLAGNPQWTSEIVVNVQQTGSQQNPILIVDGLENIYSIWQSNASGDDDLYLQKFDQSGNLLWPTADKIATLETTGQQQSPALALDSLNSFLYVAWQDNRSGNYHIYLQKLDLAGNQQWSSDLKIDNAPATANAANPKATVSSDGIIYVVWQDNRYGGNDVYLQKIDAAGNKLLTADVRLNLQTNGQQENPEILTNTNGYLAIAWQDDGSGNFDVKAAKFSENLNEPVGFGDIPLTLTGAKTLGANPLIYKYRQNFTTDGNGNLNLTNLEWDSYGITTNASYVIQKSEPPLPVDVLPGSNPTVNLFITPL